MVWAGVFVAVAVASAAQTLSGFGYALIAFYEHTVGLEPCFDVAPGAFKAGDTMALIIEGHSEVHGASGEAHRVLLNFVVEDATAEQARLEAAGVRFRQQAYEEPGVGMFATFQDPDGNLCQLVEFRG